MDCRSFRDNHLAMMDGALDDAALVAMHCHMAECPACAQHDTALRRGLLVFRNAPSIEPSADFRARLEARLLRETRLALAAQRSGPSRRAPSLGLFAAAAAGVIAIGSMAMYGAGRGAAPAELAMAPVVATQPAEDPLPPLASPVIVSSAAAGLPIWPTAMLADQTPAHFANAEFRLAGMRR